MPRTCFPNVIRAAQLFIKGTFVFTVHYAHVHAARFAIDPFGPTSGSDVTGRWNLQKNELTLIFDKRKRGRQTPPMMGKLVRGRLVLPVDVGNGFVQRRYVVAATYDSSYF